MNGHNREPCSRSFGFTRVANYRVRVLLYAGKPNCDLLPTITPR